MSEPRYGISLQSLFDDAAAYPDISRAVRSALLSLANEQGETSGPLDGRPDTPEEQRRIAEAIGEYRGRKEQR